jgi:hypothetical protein
MQPSLRIAFLNKEQIPCKERFAGWTHWEASSKSCKHDISISVSFTAVVEASIFTNRTMSNFLQ